MMRARVGREVGRMPVELYSMEGCGFCSKAKQKLDILGFPYTDVDINERIKFRPGWREDGSVELLAAFAMADNHPPVIRVGGEYHGYSKAMQVLKRIKRTRAIA